AALVQAKQFDNAVSLLVQIVAAAPENYTAHANLAVALFQLKRYPEAKREYYWIVARQPDTAVAYFFLGIIHDQLKEYPDAMANYQAFLKIADPELSKVEIEKVKLRLPILQKQLKNRR
ncbi:MAG TPA: tetratricopeptide repeat protein, partial [Pyrinomonadaceae bacterium]|nr:tetratricopeptide repeat protein [Pyrinomonadaceae bacterium]